MTELNAVPQDQIEPEAPKEKTAAEKKAEAAAVKAAKAAEDKAKADAVIQAAEDKAKADAEVAKAKAAEDKAHADAVIQAAEAKAKAKADAEAAKAAKSNELTPYQLRVTNNGIRRAVCHVTSVLIKPNETRVITYSNIQDKDLAKGNFAQMNALGGIKRFEVEG